MSIRILIMTLLVVFLAMYAWKDWYKSLCGLIVMMAFLQHPDMPRLIMGIQGLNPWNIVMASILLAWVVARYKEGLKVDMPRHVLLLVLAYSGVIIGGFLRAVLDRSHIENYPVGSMISEELINTVKWVIPGLLLFDGCRTRKRLIFAVCAVMTLYLGLAGQAARHLPPSCAIGGGPEVDRVRAKSCANMGYNRCDMSATLAGASWAMLGMLPMCRRRWHKIAVIGAFALTSYAQALTGGRAGYIAWGAVGLVLCVVRWRKYLPLAPIIPFVLALLLPAAAGRMLQGFGETDVSGEAIVDDYQATSGRTLIWPHVIDKIHESPLVGYGRMAMVRTGLRDFLGQTYGAGEAFPHPHNMYLELLLDNGIVGALPILLFFVIVLYNAAALFRSRDNPWAAVAGGLALGLVVAQLVAGIGSQHFYPRESTVGMWAGIFLALRLSVERAKVTSARAAMTDLVSVQSPRTAFRGALMAPTGGTPVLR